MGFEEVTDVRIKPRDVSFINIILTGNIIVEISNHESLIKKGRVLLSTSCISNRKVEGILISTLLRLFPLHSALRLEEYAKYYETYAQIERKV